MVGGIARLAVMLGATVAGWGRSMTYVCESVAARSQIRLVKLVGSWLAIAFLIIPPAKGETLSQAWGLALTVNQGLQAQQQSTIASGLNVKAAQSARYFTVQAYSLNTYLTASPTTKASPVGNQSGSGSTGAGGGAAAALGANTRVFALGPNQHFLPVTLASANLPIYTGGKLLKTVESAQHQLNAQRTMETQTAIDLKLTVAEAYVGVLRARRNLETSRSNVEQLTSFARDTRNRLNQQLAIRSDDLAAQVSLANAQLTEITNRTAVETAYATYNRYLCRPLDAYSPLDEITDFPNDVNWEEMAMQSIQNRGEFAGINDAEVRELAAQAIRLRPELANLGEMSRSISAQAQATKATLKPQVSLSTGFAFLGPENFGPQGNGFVAGIVNWTFTDSGKTRRQTASLKAQERSTDKQRADLAADVALQVRTRWLNLQTSRQSVPIARFAVSQAEENVKVVTDRYRQQLSTYTEVLDAENRRVQSLNAFYNAVYDENLAFFRLRRVVGDI